MYSRWCSPTTSWEDTLKEDVCKCILAKYGYRMQWLAGTHYGTVMLMADWEWTDFKFEATHVLFSGRKFSHKTKIVRDAGWVSTPPAAGAVRGLALHLHALLCGPPVGRKTPKHPSAESISHTILPPHRPHRSLKLNFYFSCTRVRNEL